MKLISKAVLIKTLKGCWLAAALLIICLALLSSFFRALTPLATEYKNTMEKTLSTYLHKQVTVEHVNLGWYWFEPIITLDNVKISLDNKELLQLNKLKVGIDLWRSLLHWQIRPGILTIDGLNISLREKNKRWQIDGFEEIPQTANLNFNGQEVAWVLNQEAIIIKKFSMQIFPENAKVIPINYAYLIFSKHNDSYQIKSRANVGSFTQFELDGEIFANNYFQKAKSKFYLSIKDADLYQWKFLFPDKFLSVQKGKGNIRLWWDLVAGDVNTIQAHVSLADLIFKDEVSNKTHSFPFLKANLAWKNIKNGWELSADHLKFSINDQLWPQNKMVVRLQDQEYSYYLEHVLLESFISLFPDNLKPNWISKIKGDLNHAQVNIKNSNIVSVLTKFSKLSWLGKNQDSMDNLSGAFYWRPTEGQLALNGKNSSIQLAKHPALMFQDVSASVIWSKKGEDNYHVNIEQFVLNHPDLQLSLQGTLDELNKKSLGKLNFNGTLAANSVQSWLLYLPEDALKKSLNNWLKNNIKIVNKLGAKIKVFGNAADFPFDNKNGEFKISAAVEGASVVFSDGWPLTSELSALLQVDGRALNIDILSANLDGNLISNGNIHINDIGLDKERLLMHSKMSASAKSALLYVLTSPLKEKLSILTMLTMYGNLDLDLRVDVPLYSDTEPVLASGLLNFKDSKVVFSKSYYDLELEKLNGNLEFNQQGIINSKIETELMGNPVTIEMESLDKPVPATNVDIKVQTTMEILQQKLKWPLLSMMKGPLEINSSLILTTEPSDFDHLTLNTSLVGVDVNLPPPFNKSAKNAAPLILLVDFKPKKTMRIQMDYNKQLAADLWLSGAKNWKVDKGQVIIGGGKALANQSGLYIKGKLPLIEFSSWIGLIKALSSSDGDSQNVAGVDLLLKDFMIANQSFKDLRLKAKQNGANSWSIIIDQKNMAANLTYQPSSKSLSGKFSKLNLTSTTQTQNSKPKSITLNVVDMPDLNFDIESLKWSNIDLGKAEIKTTKHASTWQLDSLRFITPYYQFMAEGAWKEEKGKSNSDLSANLYIKDLGKALESWQITPVVKAEKGALIFKGSWPQSFFDFSLSKVSGQMNISFKDGRITNLSKETEEKLGLGKLLSILSLQTIPRRLKLDFRDLSEGGYSFDEFKGNFAIANGLMGTLDSFINGPIAYASMKGNLDIAKQLYDIELHISPHVTASLPVVATIAGGPVAGLAAWVVSKLINKGMQKISGYTYTISGPWKQPVVKQLIIIKKKR